MIAFFLGATLSRFFCLLNIFKLKLICSNLQNGSFWLSTQQYFHEPLIMIILVSPIIISPSETNIFSSILNASTGKRKTHSKSLFLQSLTMLSALCFAFFSEPDIENAAPASLPRTFFAGILNVSLM
jgi:hypothetical protein